MSFARPIGNADLFWVAPAKLPAANAGYRFIQWIDDQRFCVPGIANGSPDWGERGQDVDVVLVRFVLDVGLLGLAAVPRDWVDRDLVAVLRLDARVPLAGVDLVASGGFGGGSRAFGGRGRGMPGASIGGDRFVLFLQGFKFLIGLVLRPDESIVCSLHGADELIQFEMHCPGIPVLGVLNQEDHQKSNDRGARIDHQLPGLGEAEKRTTDRPEQNDSRHNPEGQVVSGIVACAFGQFGKSI